jgi:hypothetical protein
LSCSAIAIGEHLFWTEFGTRFNFIAVDYLIYTREVVQNIWQSYPVGKFLNALLLGARSHALSHSPHFLCPRLCDSRHTRRPHQPD